MSGLWHQHTSMPVGYMLIIVLLAHDPSESHYQPGYDIHLVVI